MARGIEAFLTGFHLQELNLGEGPTADKIKKLGLDASPADMLDDGGGEPGKRMRELARVAVDGFGGDLLSDREL